MYLTIKTLLHWLIQCLLVTGWVWSKDMDIRACRKSRGQWSPTCNLLIIGEGSPGAHLLLLQGLLLWTQGLHIADIRKGFFPLIKVGRESVVLYLCNTCRGQQTLNSFVYVSLLLNVMTIPRLTRFFWTRTMLLKHNTLIHRTNMEVSYKWVH